LGADLLQFADDDLPELRAAAARALSFAEPRLAVNVLTELAKDPIWFVRLRAIVSLGKLSQPTAISVLLHGLSDSNRLVRLRAAEAIVDFPAKMVTNFEQVVAMRDRYGLHAYLTALENAGLQAKLESGTKASEEISMQTKTILLEVLHTWTLPPQPQPSQEKVSAAVGSRS
jgi:HEAT repeat protein